MEHQRQPLPPPPISWQDLLPSCYAFGLYCLVSSFDGSQLFLQLPQNFLEHLQTPIEQHRQGERHPPSPPQNEKHKLMASSKTSTSPCQPETAYKKKDETFFFIYQRAS